MWVNDREVGRTPLVVDFTHYGTYDVRIEREGMEPVMTSRRATPPLWDLPGPDLVVEVLPMQANSQIEWHFDLEARDESLPALLQRARAFRTEATNRTPGESLPAGTEVAPLGPETGSDTSAGIRTDEPSGETAGGSEPPTP